MQIVLLVLIGGPASGKTTFSLDVQASNLNNCVVICYDDFIDKVRNPQEKEWKALRNKIHALVDDFLESIILTNEPKCPEFLRQTYYNFTNAREPCMIVIDDNMFYRSMRYSYYQLAKKYSCSFCQIYFENTLPRALSDNAKRAKKVNARSIENILLKIEPPDKKNFWEKHFIIAKGLSNFSASSVEFLDLINGCLRFPEAAAVEPICSRQEFNVYHAVDIAVRKAISKRICESRKILSPVDLMHLSQTMANKKSIFLEQVKGGNIEIPPDINSSDKLNEFVIVKFFE